MGVSVVTVCGLRKVGFYFLWLFVMVVECDIKLALQKKKQFYGFEEKKSFPFYRVFKIIPHCFHTIGSRTFFVKLFRRTATTNERKS